MKLILAAEGVKREINGPFEICASRKDLKTLANILRELLREDKPPLFNYGWFAVNDAVDSPTNTRPRPWSEA